MTDFKQKDMIRLLENNGWVLLRKSKHLIYSKGKSIIAISHCKVIKRNTASQILKLIQNEA